MALFFRPGPLQDTIGGPFLALLMDDLGAFSRDLGASSPSFPMDVHLFTVPGWWFGCHVLFSHILGTILVAIFYFPIFWVSNHPNWLSYFSEGWPNHQPGTNGCFHSHGGSLKSSSMSMRDGRRCCLGASSGTTGATRRGPEDVSCWHWNYVYDGWNLRYYFVTMWCVKFVPLCAIACMILYDVWNMYHMLIGWFALVCYERSRFSMGTYHYIPAKWAMFHSKLLGCCRVSALPSYIGVLGPNTPDLSHLFSVVRWACLKVMARTTMENQIDSI